MPKRKGSCFLCGKQSDKKCSKCGLVFYCSRNHLLSHHQKDYCFPYRVVWKSMGGGPAGLVATRDILPLELILFEESIICGPSSGKSWSPANPACSDCLLIQDKLKCCNFCSMPVCDEICESGTNHNVECQSLAHLKGSKFAKDGLLLDAVLPIRLYMMKVRKPKIFERSYQIMGSQTLIPQDGQSDASNSMQSWKSKSARLQKFLIPSLNIPSDEVHILEWILEVTRTKSIPFFSKDPNGKTKMGSVLFPIFSLVGHSCSPNSKFTVYEDHKTVSLQSQTTIRTGELINVCLVSTLDTTWKRQAKLFRDFHFTCNCQRCLDPSEFNTFLSAIWCPKCPDETRWLLPINPLCLDTDWTCEVHKNTRISQRNIEQFINGLQTWFYSKSLLAPLQLVITCVEELEKCLHKNHAIALMAKRQLLQSYSLLAADKAKREDHQHVQKLCQDQLDVLTRVDSGFPEWKVDILKHLSSADLNIASMRLKEKEIDRTEFLSQVRKAMALVQEGLKCKSCIKIDRSKGPVSWDDLVSELSDSSYMSDASINM